MVCVCGHSKEEHYMERGGFCVAYVGKDVKNMNGYCPCGEYRPAENLLTVTLILKDGMEKSDHAIDVGYGDKEIYVDWADGTTTYAKVKTIETLLVTA